MKIKNLNGFEFFHFEEGDFNIIFFTADGNANFNINTRDGQENLKKVEKLFGLEEIGYVKQVHSDIIWEFNGRYNEGDALITSKSNIGLGVFTADCVPVIIIDEENHAVAAIHSGWKGTIEEITYKTIEKMKEQYESKPEYLKIFIGPHIGSCCYNVGQELIERFSQKGYNLQAIIKEDKLSLENCIIDQCIKAGVSKEKIICTDLCTMCSNEYNFYSYRNNKDTGRLLSLVFYKNK